MTQYRTMDEWLDEIEGFGSRRERVPADAMPWIEAAWKIATEAAIDQHRYDIAKGLATDPIGEW